MANESRHSWDETPFLREVRSALVYKLERIGWRLRDVAWDNISTQGSYRPPVHSAPGDPPYRQSGDLQRSIEIDVDKDDLSVRVGSKLPYAVELEFGRDFPTPMAPRPWLEPTLRSQHAQVQAILNS